jgi:gliding motility-associated-like protein
MTARLLRRTPLLSWLVLLLALLAGTQPALASHLLGGELTYKYLDATGPTTAPYRYEITASVYVTCNSSATSTSLFVDFYNKATGAQLFLSSANLGSANASVSGGSLLLTQSSISPCTTIAVPPGCTITGASQPYQLQKFIGVVCLPTSTAGFYAVTAPSGNRNAGINNIGNSSSSSYYMGLYAALLPASIPNRSPVFTGDAVGLICAGDTTVILNNAVDPDGDRLVYSFGQPYNNSTLTIFTAPLPYVPYTTPGGYSAATPLGTGAGYYAKINPNTGITKYVGGPTVGNRYGIAIDVTEYRTINGVEVALGTTRRDIQLLVGNCPATAAPTLPAVAAMPRSYTIEAGSTLSIPITGSQAAAHPLTLTATSALLDGSAGYNATFGGNAGTPTYAGSPVGAYTVTGTVGGTVAGTFVFTPTCTQARATPYDVTLVLRDIGCAGKLTSDVVRITVTQPTGPTNITGNLAVCGLGTTQTYTATGGTATQVQWTVTGGTIVGSPTANPVTVSWPTAVTGTIKAQGLTQYGCLADVVTKTVTVNPAAVLTATGNLSICPGGSTTLTVTGGTGPFLVTGGPAPITGPGPFVLSPTQTTTYTLSSVVLPASGCPPTGQVTVVVNPVPVATAGAAVTICPGGTAQLGAAAVGGNTYAWSPATGLSSASAANPTVTLTNTTGAPITQAYTLTVTNAAGCQASSTVAVTVAPPPVAVPGAAVAFCSGGNARLGAAAVAGLTYSWSPATGLSSATAANPIVTLTNTTGAPITQTYTLTVTNAGGCASTGTVAVTVNPAPVATAGAAVTFCSGGTGQLGAAAANGLTYSWSPATGLSSATAANPIVTLTNTTGTAITQTYILTVTNAAGCASTALVAVTVLPLPVAVPGAAKAICSGGSAQLGTVPMNSLTYSWSPATGLSSTSAANPTVTLTNATGAPITQTYTLTVTSGAGCTSTGTVVVTVNPLSTATAGAAVAFCSGGTAQLGAAAGGGLTYSWSPATGLSNATLANPTVTLTNTTGAATTQTYTLTVTNAGGCSSTATVAVTVNPSPVANAGTAKTICSGGTAQLGAATVAGNSYSWSPATGLSSATAANPTVTLTNTTGASITQTYTLTVTSATGCANTSTVVVTVNPAPVANAGAAVAFCSGGNAQLGAAAVNGLTYSWSPATGLSSATAANPTVTLTNTAGAPITQTYTLTVTSATGCANTSTVVATVNPLPVATAGAAVTFCSGSTGQLGAAPVGSNTYSWSPATGLSSSTAANPTVTLTNATGAAINQTYTLTVTNAGGCTTTSTVVVTVNPLPTATAGATVAFCSGGNAQLGAAAVGGNTYAWSPATGLSSATLANPTVTLTNTTGAPIIQTYALTVTNAGGCTSTATVAVTVNPLPIAAPGGAVAFCSGGTGQLGAMAVSGTTYAWSPATGLSSSTAANPTVTLTNATGAPITQTYTLTVTSGAGCTSTGTVVVTVNPLSTATAGAAVAFCSGGTAQLGAAAGGGLTYSWSPATGLSNATLANPTVTLTNTTSAATTQTYTLTVTNAGGCSSTATVAVTVSPQPVAVAGAAITTCSGDAGQLGAAPASGLTYSWSPATGLSSATVANPTVTLTNTTGSLRFELYTLTVTNAGGCTTTGSIRVTVLPAVTPGTIGSDQTVCAGSVPAPLTSTAAAAGGAGTYAYQWESSPNNVTWTAVAGVTSLTYTPGPVAATTYFRRRVVAGTCGAAYSNVVAITTQPLLIPAVALPVLPAQCAGTAFTFTPTPTNAGNNPTYQWFVNGTAVGAGPSYTSTTLRDGDVVRVVLTPTVGFCASGPAIATARVSLTPVLISSVKVSTSTALPVCVGAPIAFGIDVVANIGTSPQYQWQVDGVSVAGATGPRFSSSTLRDGQAVTLVVRSTDACGQPATATSNAVRVGINQPVQLSAGPNKTITEGESVVLEGTADGSYPVTWSPSQTLTFATGNQLRPVAAPLVTTTYALSAGAGYCGGTSLVTVTVLPRLRIPNAFSPNGDNNDDTWQIDNIEAYPNSRVLVFNRWGAKIFETTNYSRGSEWNGTMNGQPAPFGTYYYVITLGNGKSFTGPLTVIN